MVGENLTQFIDTVANRWDSGAYFFDSLPLQDQAAIAAERRAKDRPAADVASVVAALAGVDAHQEASALDELKRYLYPEAGPLLTKLLAHPHGRTRRDAAALLGQMGDPSVIPALMSALEDPDSAVQASARWSISELQRLQDRRHN